MQVHFSTTLSIPKKLSVRLTQMCWPSPCLLNDFFLAHPSQQSCHTGCTGQIYAGVWPSAQLYRVLPANRNITSGASGLPLQKSWLSDGLWACLCGITSGRNYFSYPPNQFTLTGISTTEVFLINLSLKRKHYGNDPDNNFIASLSCSMSCVFLCIYSYW